MALPPNVENVLRNGTGRIYFKRTGATAWADLGNLQDVTITPEVAQTDYFNTHWETRVVERKFTDSKTLSISATLFECPVENLNNVLYGDSTYTAGVQAAGVVDKVLVTTVANGFVDLNPNYKYLSYVKIEHGTVSDGPFVFDDTITSSGAGTPTADIAWVGSGFLYVVNRSVTTGWTVGATITGTGAPGPSAAITRVTVVNGAVLLDAAVTPSALYTPGTDYDIDYTRGMIRELSGGSIAANTVYVIADYAAKTTKGIKLMAVDTVEGAARWVSNPDQGPNFQIDLWKVGFAPNGDVPIMADDIATVPIILTVLSDAASHPDSPMGEMTQWE